jgi:hypothetical protein
MARSLAIAALAVGLAAVPAHAAGDVLSFELTISATGGAEVWRASALELALGEALLEHPRLEGVAADGDRLAGFAVRGVLSPERLDLEVSIDGVVRERGSIDVNGAGLVEVRRRVNDVIAPLLRVDTAIPAPPAPPTRRDPSALAIAILAALFALPVGLGLWALGRKALRLRGAAVCAGGFAISSAVMVAPLAGWQVGIAGGAAWCGFAIAAGRMIAPPLVGCSNVEPANVFRLIRVQLSLVARRAVAFALCAAPLVALAWIGWELTGLDRYTALALFAPLFGLALIGWLGAVAEVCAALCDRDVRGPVSAGNPWHRAARGYLGGTLRRLGIDLEIPRDLLIVPIEGHGVELWGGGLGHGRIGVGVGLLEFALAPIHRPHDYAEPREERLHWSEWNTGLVMPGSGRKRGVLLAKLRAIDRRNSGVFETDYDQAEILQLGQPRTLAGFVEPSALDAKLDFRPAEDPTWLDWDPDDEQEDDGIDPNDRDFLAAALAREVINLRRGLGGWRSVARVARRWRIARILGWPARAFLAAGEARVADACVALHDLGHPFVQHLSRSLLDADQRLTAHGSAPVLARRTRQIAAEVLETRPEPGTSAARERLLWLASLWSPVEGSRRARWIRRGVVAAFAVGTLAAAGAAVIRAIEYHPTYVEDSAREQGPHESETENRHERKDSGNPSD